MDATDRRILTAVQADLPVVQRPYEALARRLDLETAEVMDRLRRLVAAGIVRRIGPVFDSGRLGYVSTLVAARVPPDRIEAVAEEVSRLPGVTHNYERRGTYNLWFTLTAPSPEALAEALDGLRSRTGLPMHSLPALALYKIRATFDLTEADGPHAADSTAGRSPAEPGDGPAPETPPPGAGAVPLSPEQRALVRALQDGLSVEPEPFARPARRAGWTVPAVLEQVRAWLAEGVVRRFGAVLRHREAGVRTGGMVVLRLPEARIDAAGRRLAAEPAVTHCYRRPPLPDFPYNLYAMTHGESEEAVRSLAAALAREVGAEAWEVLFSGREFKKTSARYFLEDEEG